MIKTVDAHTLRKRLPASLLLLLVLVLTSCEFSREYPGDLFPEEDAQLVVFGFAGNKRSPIVYLFPTVSYLDTSSAAFIEDAEVTLWRNGSLLQNLRYDSDKYTADDENPLLVSGDTLQLGINHLDYGELWSDHVIMPPTASLEEVDWSYLTDDSTRIIATLLVDNPLSVVHSVSAILSSSHSTESRIVGNTAVSETALSNGKTQYQIDLPTHITIIDDFIPVDTINVTHIEINIDQMSREYELHKTSFPDGDFGGFFPPQDTLYTNIKGGQGVFFVKSTTSYLIVL